MGNMKLLTASHLDLSLKKSDLWRATTPDAVNISDIFSQTEFTAALEHLKPTKAPGPDSICPELIIHAGAALKSWLRDYLSFCLRRLKIPKTFTVLSNPYLSWGKTGQIAHISSPSSGIVQKTILARHTVEVTRGLGMGCWC